MTTTYSNTKTTNGLVHESTRTPKDFNIPPNSKTNHGRQRAQTPTVCQSYSDKRKHNRRWHSQDSPTATTTAQQLFCNWGILIKTQGQETIVVEAI